MGLRPLTTVLLFDRINSVYEAGIIDASSANDLHNAHVFATCEQQFRENQVCLILSEHVFQHSFLGCEPLLSSWGGEGIYRSSIRPHILELLNCLSKPTIVVTLTDLGGALSPHTVNPALHKVFVGAMLSLSERGADVFYKAPVPPEHIVSILQPGDAQYESLSNSST
jgi:hypothetical protein